METYLFNEILRSRKKPENYWYRIYYYASSVIIYFLLKICPDIRPNDLTVISFLMNIIFSIWYIVYAEITTFSLITIYLLLNLAHIFDCADGQLAKLTNSCSLMGEWLDHSLDCFKIFFFSLIIIHIIQPGFDDPYYSHNSLIYMFAVIIAGPLINYYTRWLSLKFIDQQNVILKNNKSNTPSWMSGSKFLFSILDEYGNHLLIILLIVIIPESKIIIGFSYGILTISMGLLRIMKVGFLLKK